MGGRGEKCKSSFSAVDFKDDGEQVRQLQGEASGGRSSRKARILLGGLIGAVPGGFWC